VRYDFFFLFFCKEFLKNKNRQAALKSTPTEFIIVWPNCHKQKKKAITFYDTVMSTCTAIVEKKTLMTNWLHTVSYKVTN